jgi:hypothetical protein
MATESFRLSRKNKKEHCSTLREKARSLDRAFFSASLCEISASLCVAILLIPTLNAEGRRDLAEGRGEIEEIMLFKFGPA